MLMQDREQALDAMHWGMETH